MRILFSTPYKPYKKAKLFEDNIDFFYYRNTLKQGIFQLRQMQSWHSLHFIAQNIGVDSVVLENPTFDQFKSELSKYQYNAIALSFTIITTHRIYDMVSWVKTNYPNIDIIIGGYGTAIFSESTGIEEKLKEKVDFICFDEGVSFMRDYLRKKYQMEVNHTLRQDLLPIDFGFFRCGISIGQSLNVIASLGCNHHCCFCSTSHQFKKKISLISPHELYLSIKASADKHKRAQSCVIFDEDFLANKPLVLEFIDYLDRDKELQKRPLFLTVFSSVQSILQYSLSELVRCKIGMLYIGVESFNVDTLTSEKLGKRAVDKVDIQKLFDDLSKAGIHTLASIIIGWDNQTKEAAIAELDQFVALNPTMYQVMPLQAVPGTPLWSKMRNENRIVADFDYQTLRLEKSSFHYLHFTREEAKSMIYNTYQKLVDFGGPWPFRMYENVRQGIAAMKNLEGDEYKTRLQAYHKILFPLYVLSFISGFFFWGKSFRKRWRTSMEQSCANDPLLFLGVILTSMITFPVLLIIELFCVLRHNLLPNGDQPPYIRKEYRYQN